MSRRTLRVTAAVAALAAASALTGCDTGSTAASYDGHTVSTSAVEDAVRDITKEAPQSNFDNASAAVFLVLGDSLSTLAKKYGVYNSTAQAKAIFRSLKSPSASAVEAVQGSLNFTALRDDAKGNAALQSLVTKADVKLNPRYGTWVKGQGPTTTVGNWIKSTPELAASN